MTWNDYMDDQQWAVVQWLESFLQRADMLREWATGPRRCGASHSLIELLENDPRCVQYMDSWIESKTRFPDPILREHRTGCIDQAVGHIDPSLYPRNYTEIIYSEEYGEQRCKLKNW